ncbi:hypothetical protein Gohar_016463, partial [Gossypium harknessii]|nr:hypothetical protein [Gossypium harknessii]
MYVKPMIWRCLKFNVCGITNEDSASCLGVLRDMEVVFNWCANKSIRSWSLQSTFADIERKIEK